MICTYLPRHIYIYALLVFCLGSTCSFEASGQISNVEYGKNRVQFHDDFDSWYRYETENFITHWYGKARNNSGFIIKLVEHDFDELERILEHHINDKIEILVYSDLTDLKQSNIGLEEAFVNVTDRAKVSGRKIFIHFDGDHVKMRRQIREGIAEVYLNDMIHGGNLQQMVKNAISYDLPEWYREGIVAYLGVKWNARRETTLIHHMRNNKHTDFDDLAIVEPRIMGNLMWYYIAQQFGHGAISNILYVSRLNRDLEQNFDYILGQTLDQTKEDAYNFAKTNILKDHNRKKLSERNKIKIKNKKKGRITDVQFSPSGHKIIYTTNELGRIRVYVQDLKSENHTLLFKTGYRNIIQATDYNYPITTWHDNDSLVYIIYEYRDIINLRTVDIESTEYIEEPLSPEYQRVYSLDYIDKDRLLLNATTNGLNNLFVYLPKTRQSRTLNNDFYDDRDAQYGYLKGEYGILFSSNRPSGDQFPKGIDTILPTGQADLFFLSMEPGRHIYQLTHTPEYSEIKPKFIDSLTISYDVDATGITNRMVAPIQRIFEFNQKVLTFSDGSTYTLHQDSTYSGGDKGEVLSTDYVPVFRWLTKPIFNSDHSQELVDSDINKTTNKLAEVIHVNGEDRLFIKKYDPNIGYSPNTRWFKKIHGPAKIIDQKTPKNLQRNLIDTLVEEIPSGLLFQSEFPDPLDNIRSIEQDINQLDHSDVSTQIEDKRIERINFSRILGSRLTFHVDDVDFRFDNEVLFDGLQNFASSDNGDMLNQPFGLLLKMKVKDLLEDYSAEVGVRYPTDFAGSEYFLVVDNNKKRIDKRYAYYRRANTAFSISDADQLMIPVNQNTEIKRKNITNILLTRWKYPLDVYRSVRATFTFRADNTFLLNAESNTLNEDNNVAQRLGLKLEYVFDNSLQLDYNIIHGTRYKIFGELINKTEIEVIDDWKFKPGEGFMTLLGLDARHYQRLDRRSILALRLAGATSIGSEKTLYYLGGVENWLFPDRNEIIPIPTGDEFVYQSLGVQMRGFNQNIRNGNSYALINSELRVPVFQYLKKRKLRSAFLRNFLITGFFDIGTAWQGTSPFSADNPLNVVTVSNNRTTLRINFFRDPIVYGYGFGSRIYMFGYNLKFDYGWGVDSGERHSGVFYFSIGKDF